LFGFYTVIIDQTVIEANIGESWRDKKWRKENDVVWEMELLSLVSSL
jgi:membrane-anchored glycerophosphoryl diester phosphodiesterase (GDPDase)